MDGPVNSHVYKEVAAAKFITKQNSICLWCLWCYMGGVEDDQDVVEVMLQP
jgi:hypothetical protein